MAELKDRLRSDLTVSMRGRDELRTATIRMVLTAVTNAEVAGAQAREISDDEVVGVLAKEAKKRRDAADAFRQGGRPDLAEREDAEAAVIAGYLPAPLTDDELDALVDAAVAETGATSLREMGAVMKRLATDVAGRADGARVAAAVKARLAGA
ncbi:MAG TPA: GatB/YqeY domain-containing protein [Jiangellaceae bacterium]|nr:GatB/YqeY domain-containing protein [Jiangellaceae bacterium]